MTINSKVPLNDIEQITYENDAGAVRVLAIGKTTAGTYLSVQVDSSGVIQLA